MADDAPTPSLPASEFEFSTEDLERFFVAKWKNPPCEVCATNSWNYDIQNSFNIIPVSDGKLISVLNPLVNVFLRVACRNCGNTKFIMAGRIKSWLESGQ
jgi:predicted nucleic-acid-binding Zn-ribbon protein